MRTPVPVLVAALAAVALASCSQRVAPSPSPATAGPPSFPRVTGTVVSQREPTPGDWQLAIRVTDPAAAYRDARGLLVQAGFHLTNDAPGQDGGNGQACTTRLCVTFTAQTRPGQEPTVDYEVFHSTGVVG